MTTFRPDRLTAADAVAPSTTADPAAARPSARHLDMVIDIRRVEAAGGAIVTVAGMIGRHDAEPLQQCLHAELDADPTVLVIDVSRVPSCHGEGVDVLHAARSRAWRAGVGIHLVHLGSPLALDWLSAAGLDRP